MADERSWNGIERREDGNWYSNKDLFEKMQQLEKQLNITEATIRKYNGIPEKLSSLADSVQQQVTRCNEVQAAKDGKTDVYQGLLKVWPVILSAIMAGWSIFGR